MSDETERKAVRTYIPGYQKTIWEEDAENMDMSLSEFVRTMVQAGRSDLELASDEQSEPANKNGSSDPTSGRSTFRDRIVSLLSEEGALDWDELVAAMTSDIETDLEETLEVLQEDNVIQYSGRQGGYVLKADDV